MLPLPSKKCQCMYVPTVCRTFRSWKTIPFLFNGNVATVILHQAQLLMSCTTTQPNSTGLFVVRATLFHLPYEEKPRWHNTRYVYMCILFNCSLHVLITVCISLRFPQMVLRLVAFSNTAVEPSLENRTATVSAH